MASSAASLAYPSPSTTTSSWCVRQAVFWLHHVRPIIMPSQIDRCFGFDSAVEEAQRALLAAKVEASSGYKGIGIVKLMGRDSGFIAMQASLASGTLLTLSYIASMGVKFLLLSIAACTCAHALRRGGRVPHP